MGNCYFEKGSEKLKSANDIFLNTMDWIKDNYCDFRFIMERDIVWTIQNSLTDIIENEQLSLKVYNDYPMIKGQRRSLSADLAILNHLNEVELVVEFKYEPSHRRNEYTDGKFPVTDRKGILHDTIRIKEFVDSGKAKLAYAIFIDEGSYFRTKIEPNVKSDWLDWGDYQKGFDVSVLWSTVRSVPVIPNNSWCTEMFHEEGK